MKKYPGLPDGLAENPKIEKFLRWYEMSGFLSAEELLLKAQKDFGVELDDMAELIKAGMVRLRVPDDEVEKTIFATEQNDNLHGKKPPNNDVALSGRDPHECKEDEDPIDITDEDRDRVVALLQSIPEPSGECPPWESIALHLDPTEEIICGELKKWISAAGSEGRPMKEIVAYGKELGLSIKGTLNSLFLYTLTRNEKGNWVAVEIAAPLVSRAKNVETDVPIEVRIQIKQASGLPLTKEEETFLEARKKRAN